METLDQLSSNTALPPYLHASEVADALIGFYDPIDLPIDSLFGSPPAAGLLPSDAIDSILFPSFSDPCVLSLPPDFYPLSDDPDLYQCPKRPKSCGDLMFEADSCSGPFAVGGGLSRMELALPPPPAAAGMSKKVVAGGGGCLSAQSVAARERRKRISEKTQELGRLIPGGNKMNTAEMFQAAFKYVKFLQAQVGILELVGSVQESKGSSPHVDEKLELLVTSPAVQEKLYGEGRCIVVKEAVGALREEPEIKSSPSVSRDFDRFIESMA